MKKNGIVILGNGFDLFHKNETSYKDFILHIKETNSDNIWVNYFDSLITIDGWVDIENEFKKILNSFSEFKIKYITYNLNTPFDISYQKLFSFLGFESSYYTEPLKEEIEIAGQRKLRTIRKIHYDKLLINRQKYNFFNGSDILNFNLIDEKLTTDFLSLKNLLQEYIQNNVTINEQYNSDNSIYKTLNEYDELIVLNFNYTSTLEYYNDNITNIYIHGSVDDEIIFGHNQIDQLEYSMFNKHIQTQVSNINYKKMFEQMLYEKNFDRFELFDLIILGHSFDENDHEIISWMYSTLFNNKNYFSSLKYFYYVNNNNSDLLSRNFNIKNFYEKSIGDFTNTTLDLMNKIHSQIPGINLNIKINYGEHRIYNGSDELDFFHRSGTFEKIKLD